MPPSNEECRMWASPNVPLNFINIPKCEHAFVRRLHSYPPLNDTTETKQKTSTHFVVRNRKTTTTKVKEGMH